MHYLLALLGAMLLAPVPAFATYLSTGHDPVLQGTLTLVALGGGLIALVIGVVLVMGLAPRHLRAPWLVLLFVLVASAAGAQTAVLPAEAVIGPTKVAIPVAVWAEALKETVLAVLAAGIAWGFRAMPSNVVALLRTVRADQLLNRALDYAASTVTGYARDKGVVSIDVGNKAVAMALQYVIDNGPKFLIDWMGGVKGIEQKLIARIEVPQDTAIAASASPVR